MDVDIDPSLLAKFCKKKKNMKINADANFLEYRFGKNFLVSLLKFLSKTVDTIVSDKQSFSAAIDDLTVFIIM